MSENKIQNENELWDVMNGEVKAEAKPRSAASKTGPKFSKNEPPKGRVDGFFLACMAGVAAVSVAATLVIGGMVGGEKPPVAQDPVSTGAPAAEGTDLQRLQDLELENAVLRAQLEEQKKQVKDLQEDLINLMGSEEYLATAPSIPEEGGSEGVSEGVDAQAEAFAIYTQIQEAYADFDREKLEELIPEMDKRLTYLSEDALQEYYTILEYVEMPSNG